MKKVISILLSLVLCATLLPLANASSANAAMPNCVRLRPGVDYSYDITGDRKADKIQYKLVMGMDDDVYSKAQVFINDKCVKTIKFYAYSGCFYYLRTRSGKKILAMNMQGDNLATYTHFYEYMKGKLVRTRIPFRAYGNFGYDFRATQFKVKGNQISLCCRGQAYGAGDLTFKLIYNSTKKRLYREKISRVVKYDYKKGKTYLTLRKGVQTYTTKDLKTKAFYAEASDKVKINKIYVNGEIACFQLENADGKKGWVRSNKDHTNTMFLETSCAG